MKPSAVPLFLHSSIVNILTIFLYFVSVCMQSYLVILAVRNNMIFIVKHYFADITELVVKYLQNIQIKRLAIVLEFQVFLKL